MKSAGEPNPDLKAKPNSEAWFTTTHWSVVMTAKEGTDTLAAEALESLCRTYWPPLYTFMRREGYSPPDAQDLTQDFFSKLLAQDYLAHLKHTNGRFRSFLLTFVKHFLSNQRAKAKAQKRGSGKIIFSLDDTKIEESSWLEPKDEADPEKQFAKRWAHTVVEETTHRLAEEYEVEGKGTLFRHMKDLEPGLHGEQSYAQVAAKLDMSETALKSAIHRMRQRFRHKLREVVAHTVASPAEIDQEIKYLMSVLSS